MLRLAVLGFVAITLLTVFGKVLTASGGYESAQYEVVEKDGEVEIRQYPDLMLASTESNAEAQGRDGSFMRLFGYISGANESDQKIEMTTPVFMEKGDQKSNSKMGFVIPQDVATAGAPKPKRAEVSIRKREGGRFAVIRFSGRMSTDLVKNQEAKLRSWLELRGLEGEESAETAGYDPPFTPGPLRRNEVIIRLIAADTLPTSATTTESTN
jgi:DNA gyrase inhibitor GyrI